MKKSQSNVVSITTALRTRKPRTKKLSDEQRFKQNVAKRDANGCELWTGGQFANGYGSFTLAGQTGYAHRFAYSLHNKALIPSGVYVLHSCDNKLCTAKAHLRLGSAADNARDKQERGRSTKGRTCNRKPFTEAEITRIVEMAASGATQYRISKTLERGEPVIAGVLKRNDKAIELKRIRLALAGALEALTTRLAPSIAAVEAVARRAA